MIKRLIKNWFNLIEQDECLCAPPTRSEMINYTANEVNKYCYENNVELKNVRLSTFANYLEKELD